MGIDILCRTSETCPEPEIRVLRMGKFPDLHTGNLQTPASRVFFIIDDYATGKELIYENTN